MRKKNNSLVMSVAVVIAVSFSTLQDSKALAEETSNRPKEVEFPVSENPRLLMENTYVVPIQTSFNELSTQMKSVLKYIKKAEDSQSGEDMYLAQLLVEKLPEQERMVATERLNQIKPTSFMNKPEAVALAEREVTLAEKDIHHEDQLKKAQQMVNDLSMSKERTDLVERLYTIHSELIKEREKK